MILTGETAADAADRLFPADPRARDVARDLFELVREAPILSPHGHLDPEMLLRDEPFTDPATLFVLPDHYVTRLLLARGVAPTRLGMDPVVPVEPRAVWRLLAEHWHAFAGTASAYWIESQLASLFGITETLDAERADRIFDEITAALATPAFRPRALFSRFRVEALATTDDPLDDLHPHRALGADPDFAARVLPTFRPDRLLDPEAAGFADQVEELVRHEGVPATYDGYLTALERRREYFRSVGATSTDHGVLEPFTAELGDADAARLFDAAMRGDLEPDDARLFRGGMLWQMARMSTRDGLVMTLHPGSLRNHHTPTFEAYGPDRGHDIPVATEYTRNLRPLLQSFGMHPDLHLVVFTLDESTTSRELAPLAGFYPSVYVGAPWWFLDAPDAILRFRAAITETVGFYRTSGFIDDTRSLASLSVRHDTARRRDAAFLARLVIEGRVSLHTAHRVMRDLVDEIPRTVFKL